MADLEYVRAFGDRSWHVNDSGWAENGASMRFSGIDGTLDQIVRKTCTDTDVGMDVAGGTNAVALRELLDSGVIKEAVVTNYEDRRSDEVRADKRLHQITGDLLVQETWNNIVGVQRELAPDGLGLELHRPVNILQSLPPTLYHRRVSQLLDMLRPGGVQFSQVPSSLNRHARRAICNDIRDRKDVAGIFISHRILQLPSKYIPRRHVLILKES
jgi:hypothetical protein